MAFDRPLAGGFQDPVLESQASFRLLLEAMAAPARPLGLKGIAEPPAPLYATTAALALTLLDQDTPLWLDAPLAGTAAIGRWLAFHCGAPRVEDPAAASFALVADPAGMPPLAAFAQGEERYPDRSTTLILQVEGFADGGPLLSGPGMAAPLSFDAAPLPQDFWDQLAGNARRYPCGVDLVLASPRKVAALPRSIRVGAS